MINDEMKIYHSDKLIIRACFSFTEHQIAADAECGLFSQNAFIQKQIKQKRSADLCRWENTTGQSEHNDSRNSNNKHGWPTDNGQAEIQINQNSIQEVKSPRKCLCACFDKEEEEGLKTEHWIYLSWLIWKQSEAGSEKTQKSSAVLILKQLKVWNVFKTMMTLD